MSDTQELKTERQNAAKYARDLVAKELSVGVGGSVSVKSGGQIAISSSKVPSGVSSENADPPDALLTDLSGKTRLKGKQHISEAERRLHAKVIRDCDRASAVVHASPPYACTLANLGKPIPASHYLVAFAGPQVPVAEYSSPGRELADRALDALAESCNACLLKKDGMLSVGATLEAAFERALRVEQCARIYYQATSVGEPTFLPDQELVRLEAEFENYGQSQNQPETPEPNPELQDERQSIADLGGQMLSANLVKGTGGSISVRRGDKLAINPSGVPYKEVTADSVPILTVGGKEVAGRSKSSTAAPMHAHLHRRVEDAKAIVQVHSPYATTFASLGEPIPASHRHAAVTGGEVPVVPYEKPGSKELGQNAADALDAKTGACVVENYGIISTGTSPEDAFKSVLAAESCARTEYQARKIGEPERLSEREIETLAERL